jgi:glutamate dehydrogenase
MTVTPEDRRADVIEHVVSLVQSRLAKDVCSTVEAFVRAYYGRTAPEELLERDPANLYGAALSMWRLLAVRPLGAAKIHVYNPQFEAHGWESSHTAVEIVTEDMRFLLDSVRMAINRQGLTVHLAVHPVLSVCRDPKGRLLEYPCAEEGGIHESAMHVEVDRQSDPDVLQALKKELHRALDDVRAAVLDWKSMLGRAESIIAELEEHPPPVDAEELQESKAFLRWLAQDHFTFLGYREFELAVEEGEEILRAVPGSELGISRLGEKSPRSRIFSGMPAEMRRRFPEFPLLILTKSNHRATVHRPVYMDYVGIKRFDPKGRLMGERRFLGLYTAAAYHSSPWSVPLVRRKVSSVVNRAGLAPDGHDGRNLLHILESYPRDELFQISEPNLSANAMGILQLAERQRVRAFVRRETYGRFYTCLVYVPRDRYDTQVRRRMERVLLEALNGDSSEFSVQLSEPVLAQVYFTVHTRPDRVPEYDVPELEARLLETTRRWEDELRDAVLGHFGEELGSGLLSRYRDAFPASYREDVSPRAAVYDLERLQRLGSAGDLEMSLYRPPEAPPGVLRFKLFSWGQPVPLSVALPLLENMGVEVMEERPYALRPQAAPQLWVHDFGLAYRHPAPVEAENLGTLFQDAFARIWRGDAENDGFNRLVLRGRLTWREIGVVRAYCKYLRQAGITFSQAYIEKVLADNPHVARLLAALFQARFDPRQRHRAEARRARLTTKLQEAIDAVASLDEDRILRSFQSVIQATLRTNYYQTGPGGEPKPYLALKLDPAGIPELPLPRPKFEVFVYSPRVEAVHLRGGRVARGGIRWSDRREDYRTEVLALMKAQMVKNAMIVPTGAKGGFVVKRPPAGDREALDAEVVFCYQTFIRGLLDLTDNLLRGRPQAPKDVVRYDDDDPYLVVAADKGTSSFSDIANEVAQQHRFWLRDAFASGGRTGYDHKRMGITARGAWEAVKRHFWELGQDLRRTNLSVVGIGDMSGDVFGNGLLQSRRVRLLAAFDHRHIFLDPDPDPQRSFQERQRLFGLERSSWADYDPAVISPGGGVYSRAAKTVTLTAEVQRALDIQAPALTPNELIRAILRAPVDLLWNGGIGTFVKARAQTQGEVGDRANDGVRVDAADLRCKVVGEGGNLGFTQAGRVEYARGGGRINTDFIDNAGGVHCSDYEVNIKVLLNQVVANGDLTQKQRNALLGEMAEEVAELVVQEVYWQTLAISLVESRAGALLEEHGRFMRALERAGILSRSLDGLPGDEELAERQAAGEGLTRPEIALLLAHAKDNVQRTLVDSDVPEAPYLASELERYFPVRLREPFRTQMLRHPLRRQIVATYLSNCMIDHLGPTFAFRLQEDQRATGPEVVRAYTVAREVFALGQLWQEIGVLFDQIPAAVQVEMMHRTTALAEHASIWVLRKRPAPLEIGSVIGQMAPHVERLAAGREILDPGDAETRRQSAERLAQAGVPAGLARRIAALPSMFAALDIVDVALDKVIPVEDVATVYVGLGDRLSLSWLLECLGKVSVPSRWEQRHRAAMHDEVYQHRRALTSAVLGFVEAAGGPAPAVALWSEANRQGLDRLARLRAEVESAGTVGLPMLGVVLGELRQLAQVAVSRAAPLQGTPAHQDAAKS